MRSDLICKELQPDLARLVWTLSTPLPAAPPVPIWIAKGGWRCRVIGFIDVLADPTPSRVAW